MDPLREALTGGVQVPPLRHCCSALGRPFWLSCWARRNVGAVEVNGYTIEPGADLQRASSSRRLADPQARQGANPQPSIRYLATAMASRKAWAFAPPTDPVRMP